MRAVLHPKKPICELAFLVLDVLRECFAGSEPAHPTDESGPCDSILDS
jgi:hypothetical protein